MFKISTLIVFFLNLTLFVVFVAITISRYILFPEILPLVIRHPVQSLYIGCFPMAATTLINVSVYTIYQGYGFGGRKFLYAIWGLWWVQNVMACLCVWGMVHIMYVY